MPVRRPTATPATSATAAVKAAVTGSRSEVARADLLRALAAQGVDTSKLDLFAREEDNRVMIFVPRDQWSAMQPKLTRAYAAIGAASRPHFDPYTGYDMLLPTHKNGVMFRAFQNTRVGCAR